MDRKQAGSKGGLESRIEKLEARLQAVENKQQDLRQRARTAAGSLRERVRHSNTVKDLRNAILEAISHFHHIEKEG